jgi:hypothetical protein
LPPTRASTARFAKTKPGGQIVDSFAKKPAAALANTRARTYTAHRGMKLSGGEFTAQAEDTVNAVDRFRVSAKEKRRGDEHAERPQG